MINLRPLAMPEVEAIYMFANTPAYLFRRMRAEWSVKAFADANSPEALINAIEKIDTKKERSPKHVSLAYAALVALTYKGAEAIKPLVSYMPKHLRWVRDILQLFEQQNISTTRIILPGSPTEARPPRGIVVTNRWDVR
jgi:hypothetical protein